MEGVNEKLVFFMDILNDAFEWLDSVHNPIIFENLSLWQVGVVFFVLGTILNLLSGGDEEEEDN